MGVTGAKEKYNLIDFLYKNFICVSLDVHLVQHECLIQLKFGIIIWIMDVQLNLIYLQQIRLVFDLFVEILK